MVMRGEVQLSKRSGFAMHLVRDPSKRCLPDIALVVKLLPERGPRKHGHRDRLEPREEGWWIEGHSIPARRLTPSRIVHAQHCPDNTRDERRGQSRGSGTKPTEGHAVSFRFNAPRREGPRPLRRKV